MQTLPLLGHIRLNSSDWAQSLLTECASAIAEHDLARAQQLLWVLNELSSPYGSHEQRLAYYFMQALFCRMSQTGGRAHLSLCAAAERSCSFDSMRRTMLKFQEASPWVTFGHVAANGAMMEALEGEASVHIIDLSTTFCTQWPTLLEAMATRAEGAPSVKLTTVVLDDGAEGAASLSKVMKEVGARLEKFARLMGVPFQFGMVQAKELCTFMEEGDEEEEEEVPDSRRQQHVGGSSAMAAAARTGLDPQAGGSSSRPAPMQTMLAINCVSALQQLPHVRRQELLRCLQRVRPKIMTVVEDKEAHAGSSSSSSYGEKFAEALQFYALYFEALEGSMGKVSSERGALERAAARRIMRSFGCDDELEPTAAGYGGGGDDDDDEDDELSWQGQLQAAGFLPKLFSDDVVDDVKALLKRYRDGWGLVAAPDHAISLTWKEQSVVVASTWTSP